MSNQYIQLLDLQGNLGILDVSTRGYTTIMRSHTDRVLDMSVDPLHRQMATVSLDHTIRVWDMDNASQVHIIMSYHCLVYEYIVMKTLQICTKNILMIAVVFHPVKVVGKSR